MAKKRKTAREKLETVKEPEVKDTPKGRMLIPKPFDVDAIMRKIPAGKLATVEQIRARLARDCGADYTCPLTTGMFLRIAAEAAEEDLIEGREPITPYWRVIKAGGSLNEKFPGGVEAQAARLREEGHSVQPGVGKKPPRVEGFAKLLVEL